MVKFLKRTWNRYSKLGKKKKQVWRKPKGRDNKMREKRKGYPSVVSIGYKKDKKDKKNQIIILNLNDLEKVKKNMEIILGNIGKKKKIEILKKAQEKKIEISKINVSKLLKKIEKSKKIPQKKLESLQNKKSEEIKK